jgi:hypothetical protein
LERNRDWLIPLLSGVGTMASSPSRYLGAAILQGVGAAAQAYEPTQQAIAKETESNIANIQKSFGFTPGLGQTVTVRDPKTGGYKIVPISEYEASQRTSAPYVLAGSPLGTEVQSRMPSIAAASVPLGVNFTDEAKSAAARDLQTLNTQQSPEAYQAATTASHKRLEGLHSEADLARNMRGSTIELMKTVAAGDPEEQGIVARFLGTPGFSNAVRAKLANAVNTGQRVLNPGGESFSDADTLEVVNAKLNATRTAAITKGIGQHSLGALETMARAFPTRDIPPTAAAELAAQMKIAEQRQLDKAAFAQVYAPHSRNVYGPAFDTQFDKDNPTEKYAKESSFLQHLMLDPHGKDFFTALEKGAFSGPKGPAQLERYLHDTLKAPPGMSRYFVSGG